MAPSYQYTLKNGDTLISLIKKFYGVGPKGSQYPQVKAFVLANNPQIRNPDRLYAGHLLRIDEYPPQQQAQRRQAPTQQTPTAGQCPAHSPNHHNSGPLPQWLVDSHLGRSGQSLQTLAPGNIQTIKAIKTSPHNHDAIWMTAWLEHHARLLTIPGAVTTGSLANLNSAGNVSLINDIQDLYANYKQGQLTKGQYDYRRAQKIRQLQHNLGPMEKLLFGQQTTGQSLRIARGGGIPATAHLSRHADKIRRVGQLSKTGGLVLTGVGMTAACLQIANSETRQEKNAIFVETLASTIVGGVAGLFVGFYLVSNPIGWGTAIILAVGSTASGYSAGKASRFVYSNAYGHVDLVEGSGVNRICQ